MSCPCKMCNNLVFENKISNTEPDNIHEVKEPQTIHERLSKLSDELHSYGAPAGFINEINDLCDSIDNIDDKIIKLQRETEARPKESIQLELGNISKELY
jgi:hypothetical protein